MTVYVLTYTRVGVQMDATLPDQDTRPKARVSSGSGGDVMLPTPTPNSNPTVSKSDHPISSNTPATDANSKGELPLPGELVSQQVIDSPVSLQQESQAASAPDPQGPLPLPMFPDPRASSAQSLLSSTDGEEGCKKRELLVIYIHGYMGSDSSFQSFPAHVHNLIKNLLAGSHIVHTKIYPRYKTYRSLELARDNFSDWLTPHESPTTDVVLVGHSMGGLLAAEVAMMVCRFEAFAHDIQEGGERLTTPSSLPFSQTLLPFDTVSWASCVLMLLCLACTQELWSPA